MLSPTVVIFSFPVIFLIVFWNLHYIEGCLRRWIHLIFHLNSFAVLNLLALFTGSHKCTNSVLCNKEKNSKLTLLCIRLILARYSNTNTKQQQTKKTRIWGTEYFYFTLIDRASIITIWNSSFAKLTQAKWLLKTHCELVKINETTLNAPKTFECSSFYCKSYIAHKT